MEKLENNIIKLNFLFVKKEKDLYWLEQSFKSGNLEGVKMYLERYE